MNLEVRIPEPELMLNIEQARAYANVDFSEPHDRYVALFVERFPNFKEGSVLDLGCGTCDVSIRFAKRFPAARIFGVDGSPQMLECGQEALDEEEIPAERIQLIEGFIPDVALTHPNFDLIMSNSLLHHLPDPAALWKTVHKYSKPGTIVFISDLIRPETKSQAEEMVQAHAGTEPEVHQQDFLNSLLASFRPNEVNDQLRTARLNTLTVEQVSDRHMIIYGAL